MSVVLATLILVVATVLNPEAMVVDAEATVLNPEATVLDAEATVQLAAASSAGAAILASERSALGSTLNRHDDAACAQIGLIQAVLKNLAEDRRDESASDALDCLYRITSLAQQSKLLAESDQVLDELLRMATRAEELDLPDGNKYDLQLQQLDARESQTIIQFGIQKLTLRLSHLVSRPLAEVESMSLRGTALAGETTLDETQAIATALEHRGDYQAVLVLCRCMNADSLPAARSMLGMLQPGLGFTTASSGLQRLVKIGQRDQNESELACRRSQCQTLREHTSATIAQQVSQAILDVREARERLVIATQLVQIAGAKTERQRAAEKLDKAPSGSEKIARLAELKRQADRLEHDRDLSLADVKLRRVMGTLVSE